MAIFILFTAHVSALSPSDSRNCRLISFRFDRELEYRIDGIDNVITPATHRHHEKPASHTSPRSGETALTHTEESQNVLEGSCRRTNTSEDPGVVSTTACAPWSDITCGKERSGIQQQSRQKAQIMTRDKSGILRIKVSKYMRSEINTAAEAAGEVGWTAGVLPARSHSPKRRRLEYSIQPGGALEARQADCVVQTSSNQSHPSLIKGRVVSDISTEAANEVRQNLTTLSTSSAHSEPITDTPKMIISAKKQSETTLWISVPSSADAVPVKLCSYMTMTALFDAVFKFCGLTEQQWQDSVLGLRTSLVWTEKTGVAKNLMLKRELEDSFEVFLEFIDTSPGWETQGCCSVCIELVMAEGT